MNGQKLQFSREWMDIRSILEEERIQEISIESSNDSDGMFCFVGMLQSVKWLFAYINSQQMSNYQIYPKIIPCPMRCVRHRLHNGNRKRVF